MIYESRMDHIGRGLIRYVHCWQSHVAQPWAQLIVVHGLGDHGGRFARMAEWLVRHGINVVACDLIGHGRSPGRRGCIASYEHLLIEIDQSLAFSHHRWPHLPQFLFGQSMGGNLVLNWGLRRNHSIRGIIAGAPMLRPASPLNDRFIQVGRRLGRWFPNFCLKTPLQVELLCRDINAQQHYLSDRWVHRRMSLRLAMSLLQSGEWALENAPHLRTPTLLMHGNDDRLTCPKATQEFAARSLDWSTLELWQGLRHDMHFEPEWTSVVDTMRRWLASQTLEYQTIRRAA